METIVPAAQAEQVADDVAPVTAEYVPAKANDVWTRRFEHKRLGQHNERRRREDRGRF